MAQAVDEETVVYVRLRAADGDTDGRLNVHLAMMDSVLPVSSHVWRSVPLSAIESMANEHDAVRSLTTQPCEPTAPDLSVLADYFQSPGPHEIRYTASGSATIHINASLSSSGTSTHTDAEEIELSGVASTSEVGTPAISQSPPQLDDPKGQITDEFLRHLAEVYRWNARGPRAAPAPIIAEQTGAPVRTVHRWIAMARKRGFLKPGRPGHAG